MGRIIKKKLADVVLEEIQRMIATGELKEGDKLPNQNQFAAQLGVSRVSLREALNTLEMIGAIEQRPGCGTVFRGRVPTLYTDHLTPPLMADEQDTAELIEARRFLEVDNVELAVTNATAAEIERMGHLVEAMAAAVKAGRLQDYVEKDVAFHHAIAEASHNRFLVHLFVTIRRLMERFIAESFTVMPGLIERSLKFHAKIYEALDRRDRRRAVAAMTNHLNDILRSLAGYYGLAKPALAKDDPKRDPKRDKDGPHAH
jgi:GntR family transcriptional repressor for pyruvate dehydrogenase complex